MHPVLPARGLDRRRLPAPGAALSLLKAAALLLLLACMSSTLGAADCCDPKSPFRPGEGWADKPATCENIAYWADRAPATNARISLAIKGRLSAVEWTGVLAYLVMCDAPGLQVVCVTYQTNGMRAGDIVVFGGGYERRGAKRVVMDPCLASREEDAPNKGR
jgi:hypothetical protein